MTAYRRYVLAVLFAVASCNAASLRPTSRNLAEQGPTKSSVDHRNIVNNPYYNAPQADSSTPLIETSGGVSVDPGDARRDLTTAATSKVTSLQLVNANTDKKIVDLEDGMVIALDAIPNMAVPSFSVNATVSSSSSSSPVQSVQFGYNGDNKFRVENAGLFALCGNSGANFFACRQLGLNKSHAVTATPFSRSSARGTAGQAMTVNFTIVESDINAPILVSLKALTSTTVDVSNGPGSIQYEVIVQDDASGIRGGLLSFGGQFDFYGSLYYSYGADLVTQLQNPPLPSIAAKNNDPVTYIATLPIRQFQPPGSFPFYVYIMDEMSNVAIYGIRRLGRNITIVNSGVVDSTGPTLVSLTALTPLTVNTSSSSNAIVKLAVTLQDDISGLDHGYVTIYNQTVGGDVSVPYGKKGNANGNGYDWADRITPPLPAGVPHTFTLTFNFTGAPNGVYDIAVIAYDAVANSLTIEGSALAALGFPSNITVVS